MRGGKLCLSNLGGSLVGFEGFVGTVLAAVANGKLGEIAVVITLPIRGVSRRTWCRSLEVEAKAVDTYILW